MREIRLVRGVENKPKEQLIEVVTTATIAIDQWVGDTVLKNQNVFKGELCKPESSHLVLDKKLEKIEIKTDKLIKKSKDIINSSLARREHVDNETLASNEQKRPIASKKKASAIEFYCLKGLPKIIVNTIKELAVYDKTMGKWVAVLDTETLRARSKKSANHIAVQLVRLQAQEWFTVMSSSNSGMRLVEIVNPEIYNLPP